MENAKSVCPTLPTNCKMSGSQSPKTKTETAEMMKVSYTSAFGSLMYTMVCIRSNISYTVRVVIRFMSNPGKEHWVVVKWILRYLKGTSSMCL